MRSFCEVVSIVQTPWFWYLIVEVFLAIFVIFLIRHFTRTLSYLKEKSLTHFLNILIHIIFFLIVSIISLILFFLFFFRDDFPPSADYHVLNAAIKNTCFLDPQKNHCPKTAQDIISIEPENFTELTKNAHLTYQYYPETNQYTLIIRNDDLWKDDNRVAVFDPRLTTAKNYGNGVDFIDTGVIYCDGKYTLTNPPPFPGPWDKIY